MHKGISSVQEIMGEIAHNFPIHHFLCSKQRNTVVICLYLCNMTCLANTLRGCNTVCFNCATNAGVSLNKEA